MASNTGKASSGSNRSGTSTKQVHPVTLSSFAPTGCELSTWAYITLPRPSSASLSSSPPTKSDEKAEESSNSPLGDVSLLPNLVTAHANSLRIYVVDPISGTLILASTYDNLAGIITTLNVLPSAAGFDGGGGGGGSKSGSGVEDSKSSSYDGLLIGFSGQPRLSIVYPPGGLDTANMNGSEVVNVWSGVLTASSIVDLTPILIERCMGSVSPLEHDLTCSLTEDGKVPTVAVVMGGGVAISTFQLPRSSYSSSGAGAGSNSSSNSKRSGSAWWRTASEPYTLPLSTLASALPAPKANLSALQQHHQSKYNKYHQSQQTNALKISHGFGDILSSAFLRGYTEPVLTILHSSPHSGGRACPGRLGHRTNATRSPLSLTAISISILQKRSVVLWSLPECIPSDAHELHPHPKGGVLVLGVNEIMYVDCAGRIQCCTAMNGWVRATGSATVLPSVGSVGGIMQPNPSPLSKLSVQLDGCQLSFVNENVAMLALRDGSLYSLELHGDEGGGSCIGVGGGRNGVCMSLSPVGKKLGSLGMISTLSALPLLQIQTTTGRSMFGNFLDKGSVPSKKEEMDDAGSVSKEKLSKVKEESSSSSLGLVFAGSRMGDSILMVYNLEEKMKLVPLEKDKEQEKAIADAVELSEQTSKRKREEDMDDDGVKKEKIEDGAFKEEDKKEDANVITISDDETNLSEEEVLRREEDALYALDPAKASTSTIIPLDNEDDRNETLLPGITAKQLYRPQILSMSVFRNTEILDSLTGLGPIGPGCRGPTVCKESAETSLPSNLVKNNTKGAMANVHPCGFGSSGGLAVLTSPGLHSRSTIESEIDCLDIRYIFPCPNLGYFFVVKKGANAGCIIMKVVNKDGECSLEEIDNETILDEGMDVETPIPSFESVRDVLTRTTIMSVKEFSCKKAKGNFVVIMARYGSAYALIILSQKDGKFNIEYSHFIGAHDDGKLIERENLVCVSFVEHLDKSRYLSAGQDLSLACVWSSGNASAMSISYEDYDWVIKEMLFDKAVDKSEAVPVGEGEEDETSDFYQDNSIVAADIFAIADSIFEAEVEEEDIKYDEAMNDNEGDIEESLQFDEDDLELYGEKEIGEMAYSSRAGKDVQHLTDSETSSRMAPSRYNTLGGYVSGAGLSKTSKVVVALSRRSGRLEVYGITEMFASSSDDDEPLVQVISDLKTNTLLWSSNSGCGQGALVLDSSKTVPRRPRVQESCAAEIRFFFSGPSNTSQDDESNAADLSILRSLCLLVETNQGDVHLYNASKSFISNKMEFKRVSLHNVGRQSKEESKHRNKLHRKGMIKPVEEVDLVFRPNRLHRFFSVSGEDGLFAATSRPQWFVSERGAPSSLNHRLRHCAPAGGAEVPVVGFCSGFPLKTIGSNVGFITIHNRIGRVGTQRLTLFNGLSDVFATRGLMPGGGMSVEKIPLGVTVREIHYIDDPTISTPSHPIYALLISKEIDVDQSALMDDGLTPEQRQEIEEEKEQKRMAKQVEADLGGFDIEQEWVEEIERDDCFEIEKRYGGAPPIPQSKYEIWILDSDNWQILDSYQLDEYEHGMSMSMMKLSDISQDAASGPNAEESVTEDIAVLAVGTGIVDADGEDVNSKGRILLFELKRVGDRTAKFELELNFYYEKAMSLGPVTSVGCLLADGKGRMIVGAGAEITIEQWGNGKLTQVGFFHCYMQVQDIVIFKNFVILSDAYDSLHFLVWRESDKSLTLLAKDYEPTSMYAAGLLSRGGTLSFVSHDDRQNLTFLSYAPGDLASRGGNKLVCKADCHLGTQTTALSSHACRSSLVVNSATTESTMVALKQQDALFGKLDDDNRFGLHYGSMDGAFGTIVPVSEGSYWRLAALQSVMSNALESDCSLSHRAWRLYRRAPRRGGCRSNDRKKGVVDGDLVLKFADLPITEQEDLASAIGSTVDLILDNLLEVGVSSMVV